MDRQALETIRDRCDALLATRDAETPPAEGDVARLREALERIDLATDVPLDRSEQFQDARARVCRWSSGAPAAPPFDALATLRGIAGRALDYDVAVIETPQVPRAKRGPRRALLVLGIVLGGLLLLAGLAALAFVPNLLEARLSANETAAISTLRNIASAQVRFQATAKVDTDRDGIGEYGGFLEMSGAAPGRMQEVLTPPLLSGAFRVLMSEGVVSRSGYLFRLYLPGPAGLPVPEPREGFRAASLDATLGETTWCCYAWPVAHGTSGNRTFFVNQGGDVLGTEDARYSGPGEGPQGTAAFRPRSGITGEIAIGDKGTDGNLWRQAN
jgi:hypothetical protein